jgi:hypothetical protein
MRQIAVLLLLGLGLLTTACADQSSFGPSSPQLEQLDDNTMADARSSTAGGSSGGGNKVSGSAG